ncbi:peptide chain release factor 2 [Patescibacteria group bacterium]|nr:peptide chain release factor 2 [Patescibacteria group bacterium]MBU1075516.1 peptide chain release factor 2 [Patescibacteria group bacterium]MBU1951482.1 peptide chain release factor 2 [Patescibacteria group bacterium]
MRELIEQIEELKEKISGIGGFFDLEQFKTEIKILEQEMNQPDFWNTPDHAKEVSRKADELKKEVQRWEALKKEVDDLLEIAKIDQADQDVNLRKEVEKKYQMLAKQYEEYEFFTLMNGEYDRNDAIVSLHAGTGGIDAQDWSEMLLRMYLRFSERKNFTTTIIQESKGQEAGIKSATLMIKGLWAYGYLKAEAGVHRLVRISPFDAEKMRHTSFALVEVIPDLGDISDIEIEEDELRIDTYRSSGHGGQSVNTTDSAVRITHIPTGLTVSCQNERSQLQNKEFSLKILKNKLFQLKLKERKEKSDKLKGATLSAEWGNQIRSYVLHPYKMVKDHRTEFETVEPDKVLDGELEDFIEAFLRKEVGNKQ